MGYYMIIHNSQTHLTYRVSQKRCPFLNNPKNIPNLLCYGNEGKIIENIILKYFSNQAFLWETLYLTYLTFLRCFLTHIPQIPRPSSSRMIRFVYFLRVFRKGCIFSIGNCIGMLKLFCCIFSIEKGYLEYTHCVFSHFSFY